MGSMRRYVPQPDSCTAAKASLRYQIMVAPARDCHIPDNNDIHIMGDKLRKRRGSVDKVVHELGLVPCLAGRRGMDNFIRQQGRHGLDVMVEKGFQQGFSVSYFSFGDRGRRLAWRLLSERAHDREGKRSHHRIECQDPERSHQNGSPINASGKLSQQGPHRCFVITLLRIDARGPIQAAQKANAPHSIILRWPK
jgi:hypothetical protein